MNRDSKILIGLLVLLSALLVTTFFSPSFLDSWNVYLYLRLPRYGIAFVAGGGLAVAGYLSQLVLNNPLAEPYVLGITGGASVGVNLALFLGLPLFMGGFYLPYGYALLGAFFVSFLIFYKFKSSAGNTVSLLLVGLAINFFASALVSLMMYLSKDNAMLRDMSFWFMGSYARASLSDFIIVGGLVTALVAYVSTKAYDLYKVHLGVVRAKELGVNTHKLQLHIVVLITLITTLVVSICGPIGFVGLLIPHFIRQLKIGYKMLVPITFLLGGITTLMAETISNLLFPTVGLPPGVITAMLGIPVFLYLLKNNYRFQL